MLECLDCGLAGVYSDENELGAIAPPVIIPAGPELDDAASSYQEVVQPLKANGLLCMIYTNGTVPWIGTNEFGIETR